VISPLLELGPAVHVHGPVALHVPFDVLQASPPGHVAHVAPDLPHCPLLWLA
jgi:hypothetical protein